MENHLLKMSGAGNRFLLADSQWFGNRVPAEWKEYACTTRNNFEDFLKLSTNSFSQRKKFMKNLLSNKDLSLAEGLVVLKLEKKMALSCDFYNKDGSTAEMCGNAACCISVYTEKMPFSVKTFLLGTEIISRVPHGGIALKKEPIFIKNGTHIFNGRPGHFTFIKPGAPHGVMECPSGKRLSFKNKSELRQYAQSLRFKNFEGHKGMNVSFFQIEKQDRLQAITYERGVEDFTLACGTGALAVALVYLHKYQIKKAKTIFINMPGGELKVQFEPQLALFSPVKKGF